MNFKSEIIIKNVDMPGSEFVMQLEMLLRRALNYTVLYSIQMHDKYCELKEAITPFKTELMNDDIKKKIEYFKAKMKYYNDFIKKLNSIRRMEVNSKSLNERLEVMKIFNETINEWMLKEPGL